jgi:hypothetical protein
MAFYSAKPLRFLLNKDVWNLILIVVLIWKLYYYYFGGSKTTLWDVANSTYKITNYTINFVNDTINYFILILLFVYIISNSILYK